MQFRYSLFCYYAGVGIPTLILRLYKIFYSSKANYAYLCTYQISAPSLNYFLRYKGSQNPRWRGGCAHAPPSGKNFQHS